MSALRSLHSRRARSRCVALVDDVGTERLNRAVARMQTGLDPNGRESAGRGVPREASG